MASLVWPRIPRRFPRRSLTRAAVTPDAMPSAASRWRSASLLRPAQAKVMPRLASTSALRSSPHEAAAASATRRWRMAWATSPISRVAMPRACPAYERTYGSRLAASTRCATRAVSRGRESARSGRSSTGPSRAISAEDT